MRVSDVFEKLNPRTIWTDNRYYRYAINGFFYDPREIYLMDVLLRGISVKPHWYKRRKRKEWILQISGEDVWTFLQFYKWKDTKKLKRQERMLRGIQAAAYNGTR